MGACGQALGIDRPMSGCSAMSMRKHEKGGDSGGDTAADFPRYNLHASIINQ
jgi:hypothetical protein